MRAGRLRRAAASLALALAAALWGLTFRLEPQREVPAVAAASMAEEGDIPALAPGESAPGGVAFRNRGRTACRLRVKILAPELDGLPALEAGDLREDGFAPAGTGEEEREYWSAQGGYLYYRNRRTGDLLLPGRETPAAYTAVRLNPELGAEEVQALRLMGAEQLYVVAQAQSEEGGGWIDM